MAPGGDEQRQVHEEVQVAGECEGGSSEGGDGERSADCDCAERGG